MTRTPPPDLWAATPRTELAAASGGIGRPGAERGPRDGRTRDFACTYPERPVIGVSGPIGAKWMRNGCKVQPGQFASAPSTTRPRYRVRGAEP